MGKILSNFLCHKIEKIVILNQKKQLSRRYETRNADWKQKEQEMFQIFFTLCKECGNNGSHVRTLRNKGGESFTSSVPYLMCTKQRFSIIHWMLKLKFQNFIGYQIDEQQMQLEDYRHLHLFKQLKKKLTCESALWLLIHVELLTNETNWSSSLSCNL